jgi:hypothetical protein
VVARQLDDAHVVIRADFDYRGSLLRQFPETFSVAASAQSRLTPPCHRHLPAGELSPDRE